MNYPKDHFEQVAPIASYYDEPILVGGDEVKIRRTALEQGWPGTPDTRRNVAIINPWMGNSTVVSEFAHFLVKAGARGGEAWTVTSYDGPRTYEQDDETKIAEGVVMDAIRKAEQPVDIIGASRGGHGAPVLAHRFGDKLVGSVTGVVAAGRVPFDVDNPWHMLRLTTGFVEEARHLACNAEVVGNIGNLAVARAFAVNVLAYASTPKATWRMARAMGNADAKPDIIKAQDATIATHEVYCESDYLFQPALAHQNLQAAGYKGTFVSMSGTHLSPFVGPDIANRVSGLIQGKQEAAPDISRAA